MVPEDCFSNPAMQRKSVVLPQPDGPKKQANSPSSISIEMSCIALNEPKFLLRFSTDRKVGSDFSVIILLSIKQNICDHSFDVHYFLVYLMSTKNLEGSWAELILRDTQPNLLVFNDCQTKHQKSKKCLFFRFRFSVVTLFPLSDYAGLIGSSPNEIVIYQFSLNFIVEIR